MRARLCVPMIFCVLSAVSLVGSIHAGEKQLLWGDTHLHTNTSPDAYVMGTRSLTPNDAFRFARGAPVISEATGQQIRLDTPLDFLVVADHAEYLGVVPRLLQGDPQLLRTPTGREFDQLVRDGRGREAFSTLVQSANNRDPILDFDAPSIKASAWQSQYEAADNNNFPGSFTALIGWEWSSITDGANLHRVIFIANGADVASQFLPFSLFDSDRPEDLWQWLHKTAERTGAEFVAIGHNGNISKGRMFSDVDSDGNPLSAEYARARARWEPVYEVTQIKGDGETRAQLSPNDEFAEFETYAHVLDFRDGAATDVRADKADYARSALKTGLELEQRIGVNPFQFGLIGASDSHTGVTQVEEYQFGGKFPVDSQPRGKYEELTPGVTGNDMSAAGLAGVWAEANTREAIVEAFRRREVYATTGPRIRVRFFAGWDFSAADVDSNKLPDVGYRRGVPMGGTLTEAPAGKPPGFLIQAMKDPHDANLDRIQIVKGWLDEEGDSHEKVFNVAASDGREITDNYLTPVGNTVNTRDATWTDDIGAGELAAYWQDPEFNPMHSAFYYVRVLQIPTPRQSLYAAVARQDAAPARVPASIQERAYSSPVWYRP